MWTINEILTSKDPPPTPKNPRSRTCSVTTSPTTNLICSHKALNPGFRDVKPASNYLNYGTPFNMDGLSFFCTLNSWYLSFLKMLKCCGGEKHYLILEQNMYTYTSGTYYGEIFLFCRYQSGDGHQLLRHCKHSSGTGHDEVLEGEAYHTEETGKSSAQCGVILSDTGPQPL
jgi:hypothetical protein